MYCNKTEQIIMKNIDKVMEEISIINKKIIKYEKMIKVQKNINLKIIDTILLSNKERKIKDLEKLRDFIHTKT